MLSQDYPIEIEKPTYWHDETGDDVLIDIPDVSLLNRISTSVDAGKSITSAELPSIQPTKIILTTPEEVTEPYGTPQYQDSKRVHLRSNLAE